MKDQTTKTNVSAENKKFSLARKVGAWSIHTFTATGSIFPFFAIIAIFQQQWRLAMVWIMLAIFVDAIDGTFARAIRIKEVLPYFDGHKLDACVDFLNFVFVPVLFLYKTNLLPEKTIIPSVIAILLVSCYHYGNLKALTSDKHWLGFPALWNGVVFYMFILGMNPWWNFTVVVFFCIIHFVPVRIFHLTQASKYKNLYRSFFISWILINIIILYQYPTPNLWLLMISILGLGYLAASSIFRTFIPQTRYL